ncbi:hypothetical protein AERO8C_120407 [Aeromonas veronii]|uniref:Uncharacterized protein n=1 Tax=Aeromonas veronii TaxID=654 RepID=A0A653KRT6_AERVE|nr:hypothetical protein AERO8C_120407 [Aeromonas veronii]
MSGPQGAGPHQPVGGGRAADLLRRLHRLAADQSVYLIGVGEMREGEAQASPSCLAQ